MSEQLHAETMQPEGLDLHYEDVAQQSALSRLGDRISEFASGAVESARFNARRLAALGATATTLAAGGAILAESTASAESQFDRSSLPQDPTFKECSDMLKKGSLHYSAKITGRGVSNGENTYFAKVKISEELPSMENCPGDRLTSAWAQTDGHAGSDALITKGNEAQSEKRKAKLILTEECRDGRYTVTVKERRFYIDGNQKKSITLRHKDKNFRNVKCD